MPRKTVKKDPSQIIDPNTPLQTERVKRNRGAPKAYSDEVVTKMCALIENGTPPIIASEMFGVSTTTFHRWMAAGEEHKTGTYRDFWLKITEAKGKGQALLLSTIRIAAQPTVDAAGRVTKQGDWKAAAWLAARLNPKALSDRGVEQHSIIKHDITLKGELKIKGDLTEEELMERMRVIEKRVLHNAKQAEAHQSSAEEGGPPTDDGCAGTG